LKFDTKTEEPTGKGRNILNLPYSDSESEAEKKIVQAEEETEYSMEPFQDIESFSIHEEGQSSKKTVTEEMKLIKKLKKKLKVQTVLERVIKQRYETLSQNFEKTYEAFRLLAIKRVKDKRKMKKIIRENNKWWRIARQLKIKNKLLKNRMIKHSPLQPCRNC